MTRAFRWMTWLALGFAATLAHADDVERGKYLATAGDCAACHTARRGEPYAGGRVVPTPFGAIPVRERVVRDGNLITGGGITAGIDFALTLAAELAGDEAAQLLQLELEYAPAPPFHAGSPDTAPRAVVERARSANAQSLAERTRLVHEAAAKL